MLQSMIGKVLNEFKVKFAIKPTHSIDSLFMRKKMGSFLIQFYHMPTNFNYNYSVESRIRLCRYIRIYYNVSVRVYSEGIINENESYVHAFGINGIRFFHQARNTVLFHSFIPFVNVYLSCAASF